MHHDQSNELTSTSIRSIAGIANDRKWKMTVLPALLGILCYASGCNSELGQQFRRAAGPQLEAGITQVLNGIVDGAFEVYQPDNDSTDSTTN